MLGAFSVYYLCSLLHINYFIALLISMMVMGLFGLFLERLFFRPVRERGFVTIVIITTGLMLILTAGAQLVFGTASRGMAEVFHGSVSFLGVTLTGSRIMAMLISIALLAGVYFFVYGTKQGRAMQAIAQDREAAALQGVDINRVSAMGFGLGFALAAAAGGLMAPNFFIDATMGGTVLFKALAIIILGGLGSIPGATLGGLILGIVESFGLRFLGYISSTFPFILLILVLLVRPRGLMGGREL